MAVATTVMCVFVMAAGRAEPPGLGVALSEAEVAALDFSILPDGQGLPTGSGNAAQGEQVYVAHCQTCHGEQGVGGTNDRLAGGSGSIASTRPVKTVGSYWPYATTVFDYIRRAMPLQTPGQLTDDEIYAVTAYLLFINDIVTRDEVLSAVTLPEVLMPNHGNFQSALDD